MKNSCHVADQFCEHHANFEGADCRAKCFCCGEYVCTKCSSKRKYLSYGIVRLCNTCQIYYDGNDKIVLKRMYKLAGY